MIQKVIKRDGRVVDFDREKIVNAIYKAGREAGEFDRETAVFITGIVVTELEYEHDGVPFSIEVIQNKIENVLMRKGFYGTAKAFILYREHRRQLREIKNHITPDLVEDYLTQGTWEVHENANINYSIQGLKAFIAGKAEEHYWLDRVYPKKIADMHRDGWVHIHNLSMLSAYCCGWDLEDLIKRGFGGPPGKPYSKPAKHLSSILGQMMNFLFTLQNEVAGAVAFSSFDTYLAPFVHFDKLSYKEVKQQIQEFVYNMNQTMRTGGQSPFSNITIDIHPHPMLKDRPVIVGGREHPEVLYRDLQKEMNMINKAFWETMIEGDGNGRPFTFPIPTINVDKDFDWQNPELEPMWEATRKYGTPYFANFVNSDLKPEDARSMCLEENEEIIVKDKNGFIEKGKIKDLVEKYKKGAFDFDGWADVSSKPQSLSLNFVSGKVEWADIIGFLRVEDDKIVQITTEDGKTIKTSSKHLVPLFGTNGLKNVFAKDVKAGDYLLSLKTAARSLNNEYPKIDDLTLNEDLAKILGYFTADGNYLFETRKGYTYFGMPKGMQFTFNGITKEHLSEMRMLVRKVFGVEPKEKKDPRYNSYYMYVYNSDVSRKLYNAGFKKYGKLPNILFNAPRFVIKAFLEYHFKGDGYKSRKEIHINDVDLAKDLVILYGLVGTPVTYKERENSQVIRIQHRNGSNNKKDGTLSTPLMYQRVPGFAAKSTYRVPGLVKSRMVGLPTLEKYDAATEMSDFIKNSDFYITRVKEVKITKLKTPRYFYDIELDKNHLFVHSLGTITHNCCRLRLDTRELRKKGGGLFGANPLTGCYDEKTEILTTDGWKLFKDLTLNDEVFTLSEDNRIEVHKPVRLFKYDWDGYLYRFKAKSLDLLVTPNHKMVVDTTFGERKFVKAEDFVPNTHRIPKRGIWNGVKKEYFMLPSVDILIGAGPQSHFTEEEIEEIRNLKKEHSVRQIANKYGVDRVTVYNICTKENYGNRERVRTRIVLPPLRIKMNDWLKFFGIYLAEGSFDNDKIAKSHGYRVFITQSKESTRKEIKEVLDKLPFNYREIESGFVITNKQLWSYVKQFGHCYNKFIPKEIKNLSRDQLQILFDWLVKGDGHVRPLRGIAKVRQMTYYTVSKRLADDVQEIAMKLGYMATITVRQSRVSYIRGRKIMSDVPQYTVGIQQSSHYRLRENNIKREYYRGKVYSCEVKNHTLFVRRNGKVAWSGNSIGVITIDLPRVGYLSKTKEEFFDKIAEIMDAAKDGLVVKRKTIERFTEEGLYPYSKVYLEPIKESVGSYWGNHFSTIGVVGMNEALLNFMGKDIGTEEGIRFAIDVLTFMRERMQRYQAETNSLFNLEATPSESTAYSLALIDKKKYPDIIVANEEEVRKYGADPFYTNSAQLPVNYTDDPFEVAEKQNEIQSLWTGGTVVHFFLGEPLQSGEQAKLFVKKVIMNYKLPYITITPTFSICPKHGYIPGEHEYCPYCDAELAASYKKGEKKEDSKGVEFNIDL